MNAVAIKCPNCGAGLGVDHGTSSTTCTYCGEACQIQGRSRIFQTPRPLVEPRTLPVALHSVRWLNLIWIPIMLAVLATIIVPIALHAKASVGDMGWDGKGAPVFADVDGNGVDDVVGIVRYVRDGDRMHMAAFDGSDGHRLWQSPRLGTYMEVYQGLTTVVGTHVLRSTSGGQVRAFDLATGVVSWTAELGEAVERWCAGGEGEVVVMTSDQRGHRLSLATGQLVGASVPMPRSPDPEGAGPICVRLPDDDEGSARVALEERPDRTLAGLRANAIATGPGGVVLALAERDAGTAVPTLARLDGDRIVWQTVIPTTNPLTSTSPDDMIAFAGDRAAVIYETSDLPAPHLTAISLADGSRLWDVAVGKGTTIVMRGLGANQKAIFLSSWGHLQAFDPATGRRLFTVGSL